MSVCLEIVLNFQLEGAQISVLIDLKKPKYKTVIRILITVYFTWIVFILY